MPHVEQQSHGCTTLASKHANHLTTSKVRAPLLRVHTTLYDARTNDRETQCDRKRRTRSPLNFKHVQKSDATAGERKIACNGSDSSCNVAEPSCEYQKAGSQSVLKWSCANCERGFTHIFINKGFSSLQKSAVSTVGVVNDPWKFQLIKPSSYMYPLPLKVPVTTIDWQLTIDNWQLGHF